MKTKCSYKRVKNESLCVILMLTSELFFFCCTINLLVNDRSTNMLFVRIMISEVPRLGLLTIMLGEASTDDNTVFKGVKNTSHTKSEGRKYYFSNLSIK